MAEYETVMVNFTKVGNHDSSFTKLAMRVLLDNDNKSSSNDSNHLLSSCSDDEDDEFGMEDGGFCCFTNSLPVIYLRVWLNKTPHMVSFVSHRIPD
jgi:hypothetical protein